MVEQCELDFTVEKLRLTTRYVMLNDIETKESLHW